MPQPHIIDVRGAFVGLAVPQPDGYRFIALDVRLDELDGSVWVTLPALHQRIERERGGWPHEALPGENIRSPKP